MGRIVGNGKGGGVPRTRNHTTLEPLYYSIVKQCTTYHPLGVVICA